MVSRTQAGGLAALVAVAVAAAVPHLEADEGRRNVPYYDVSGHLTVCDGHTGRDIDIHKVYTDNECDVLLGEDMTIAAEGILRVSPQLVDHHNQFKSAILFTYNLGVGTYQHSTVRVLFNEGRYKDGCLYMLKYNKPKSIIPRRKRDTAICLEGL